MLLNSPDDVEIECLIVIPMEFISESGDHIFLANFYAFKSTKNLCMLLM